MTIVIASRPRTRQPPTQTTASAVGRQCHRVLAAEHDVEQQALLAEALTMLFERYGKTTRAQMLGTWRKARIP
jgi:hypothetical protein